MESGVKSQTSGIVFSFPYLMVGGKEVDLWEVLEGHGVWLRSQRDVVAGRALYVGDGVVYVRLYVRGGVVVSMFVGGNGEVIDMSMYHVAEAP